MSRVLAAGSSTPDPVVVAREAVVIGDDGGARMHRQQGEAAGFQILSPALLVYRDSRTLSEWLDSN